MRNIPSYSVVIPLHGHGLEVSRAVASAFGQSVPPAEIIVVDDASPDGGAEMIEGLGLPGVKVVRQGPEGVCAARNRGIAEATGDYICFLEAGDWWDEDFLHHITNMINKRPGCGLYCTGWWTHRPDGKMYLNEHRIKTVGPVRHFFRTALRLNLCHPSAAVVPREVFAQAGLFPAGMPQGGETHMWVRIAKRYDVCYLPARMSNVNRMERILRREYEPDPGGRTFLELSEEGRTELNEYLARCRIDLAILQSENGFDAEARQGEVSTTFARHSRWQWLKLWALNRMPVRWRRRAVDGYKKVRWVLLHR